MKFITDQPILLDTILQDKPEADCGATSLFVGRVRNHHEGRSVARLFYECYPAMADLQIGKIVESAKTSWGVKDVSVLHRAGWLEIGDIAIVIAVHCGHRDEAFQACREILEEIKKTVPIWKKEMYTDGTSDWVLTCQGRPAATRGRHFSRVFAPDPTGTGS